MCKCIVPRAYEQQIQRQWWMRLIPFSALYFCTHCEAKTLRLRAPRA